MSYETVLTIVVIISIPAFLLVVSRMIAIKRHEKAMSAELNQLIDN